LENKPAVQNMFFVFFIWKRILFRLRINYVFSYLQNCHWFCFSHNFSVLTLIWPVQIVLGSYLRALHVSTTVK
jgi:hypothetical protein